jgi:uncharacterized protein (DUF362 family)
VKEKKLVEPVAYRTMDRRDLLRVWGPAVVAGVTLTGAGSLLYGRPGRHRPPAEDAAATPRVWRTAIDEPGRLVVAGGAGPVDNTRRAMAALGGMERFVGRGEKVAIKPNAAWDRTPEQAANTDPEIIGELVRQCFDAGASKVTVLDNTCHNAKRAFERSGIAQATREAGGKVANQNNAGTTMLDLGGLTLGRWKVLTPIVEADRLINVPVVKHHSLARVTLGMKNWFGAIVGARPSLHQTLGRVCAELGAALNPTLTVMDATRVMTGGGPTGGSLSLVRTMDLVAAATDPVAADAWGASLLDVAATDLAHIAMAEQMGLGVADWQSLVTEV